MHIETKCPGCGRKLRVAAENAGKPARCPVCNTIYTVPEQSPTAPADPTDRWHLKTPEGKAYGPVTREVLDGWVAEGRVSDDCRLMRESEGVWQDAVEVYPILRPMATGKMAQPVFDNPVTGSGDAELADLSHYRIVNPHRGPLVLTLGILSWAIGCPIFGILAWTMGSSDLQDMQRGSMNTEGRALTQAGQIIGMIHVIVVLVVVVFVAFAVLALRML